MKIVLYTLIRFSYGFSKIYVYDFYLAELMYIISEANPNLNAANPEIAQYDISQKADELWSAWFYYSGPVGGDCDFVRHVRACYDTHRNFIEGLPLSLALKRKMLEVVMEQFEDIAQDSECLGTIWQSWLAHARADIDGSDEELFEWASKYFWAHPWAFVGDVGDVDVIRAALRAVADVLLATVLRYFNTNCLTD